MALRWRAAVIVLAGLLAYANALSGPFMFDDDASVVDNMHIREWRPAVVLFPNRESPTAGRPIVNLSFAINYAIGGLEVTGYHVGNIAIHLLCALVLFGVGRRTLDVPTIPESLRGRSSDIAFAVALLWTLHPLNSEAVNYITQRTESLMALFYLLTVYCAIRAQTDRRPWSIAAVVFCALGMACKESMVTAPVAVLLYDRVFLAGAATTRTLRERWPLYGGLAATWLVLPAVLWSGPRIHSAGFAAGVSVWTYLLNQTVAIARYLWLAIWPRSLVLAYGEPRPLSLVDVLPCVALVAALLVATVVALRRWPRVGFLGAWFFLTLAPTSSVVPIATEVAAERRMYLPLAALVALAVVGIAPRLRRSAAVALLVIVSTALGGATLLRNREYQSPLGMAETVLARWPTGFSQALVGLELARAGRHDEAIRRLREAAPTYALANYHLGGELYNTGQLEQATGPLQQFIRERPQLLEAVRARTMIGRIYSAQRKWTEAAEQFQLVLSMTASTDDAHITATGFLADTLFSRDKFEEAARTYSVFLASRPNDEGALINFGISLASTGHSNEALTAFRRAIAINPKDVTPRRDLVKALFNAGQLDAAAAEGLELLRVRPTDAVAHDLLGRVYAEQGKLDEARKELELAVQLDPQDAQAREDLELLTRVMRARK